MARIKLGSGGLQLEAKMAPPVETPESKQPQFDMESLLGELVKRMPQAQTVIPEVDLSPVHKELEKLHKMFYEAAGAHNSHVSNTSMKLKELEERPAQVIKETVFESVVAPHAEIHPSETHHVTVTEVHDVSSEYKQMINDELVSAKAALKKQKRINIALGALSLLSLLIHLIK